MSERRTETEVLIEEMESDEKAAWKALVAESAKFAKDAKDDDRAQADCMRHALAGDASFFQVMALAVNGKILRNLELSPIDRVFLSLVLRAIEDDAVLARTVLGVEGRGAPKKGAYGAGLALDVIEAANELGAVSIEDAWEIVAERRNVSASLVKQSWIRWKSLFVDHLEMPTRETFQRNRSAKKR